MYSHDCISQVKKKEKNSNVTVLFNTFDTVSNFKPMTSDPFSVKTFKNIQ